MKNKNLKLKLKDRPIFKTLIAKGKPILSGVLATVGDLLGKDSLITLGKIVSGSKELTGDEIAEANHQIDVDLEHFRIEEENKTERWKYDMQSDSFLSKNIRPMTVAAVILVFIYVMIAGIHGKTISDAYVGLLGTVILTIIGGYFTLRWDEKRKSKNK